MKQPNNLQDNGRELALEVLLRVEQDEAFANRMLHAIFLRYKPQPMIRAQATDLVYGTLRHLSRLDYLLNQLLKKPIEKIEPWVRNLLRMAVFQLGDGNVPSYAVVNESVKIAKKRGHEGISRLVNGVLRSYTRSSNLLKLPTFSDNPREHLIVAHSHPAWLINSWLHQWDQDTVHHLVKSNNLPGPLTLRINTLKTTTDSVFEELKAEGVLVESSTVLPEAIKLLRSPAMEEFKALQEGRVSVQDLGAMLISYLVAPSSQESIIDLCAAPGSKTTHLAELMKDSGQIVAVDQYEAKTNIIKNTAARMGIHSICTITADAREWKPSVHVDAVLLDAPCSGTGVIRRRPDLKWRRTKEDIQDLIDLQRALMNSAAEMIQPGGRLIYSTCSVQFEENEEQIQWFLAQHPDFRRENDPNGFRNYIQKPGLKVIQSNDGYLLLPSDETDGFFMSRLNRIQ